LNTQAAEIVADDEEESLRDTIESAFRDAEESQDEPAQKTRDERGRFASASEAQDGKAELPGDASASSSPAPASAQAASEPVASEPPARAPEGWTAEAKAEFANLPKVIQNEVLRREADIHRGLTRDSEERAFAKQMREVVTPYMPIINAEGGNPVAAVQNLLNTAYVLRTASPAEKGRLIAQIAQEYGAQMPVPGEQPYIDPQVQALQSRVAQMDQWIQQSQISQQQQQELALQSQIQAFASDPANQHFEQVKAHMASLLSNGLAADLKDAYQQAIWANPDVRSSLLKQQEAEKEEKLKSAMRARTDKARSAAVSVRGSPGTAVPTAAVERSLRDELAAQFAAVSGRV
jgi:hypothetical protein